MSRFQIIDTKTGEAVRINELDRQAAEFWGVKLNKRSYAQPKDYGYGSNWFDIIGFGISQMDYSHSWNGVVSYLFEDIGNMFLDYSTGYNDRPVKVYDTQEVVEKIQIAIDFFKPYVDLINHWQAKGYQPKQIKE